MNATRILPGAVLVALATASATALAADGNAAAPAPKPTIAQLQAENEALKARVAELTPMTMWEKMQSALSFQPAGLWILVGFFGQFVFMMRFVVQWIASERKKQSVVPVAFWYLSLAGSLITIVYSVYRKDPVFTFAFCLNILIYMRNLYFIHRKPQPQRAG